MSQTKVTDPAILKQLNARKVTDPNLLAQLNGEAPEDNENLLQKFIRYGVKDPLAGVLTLGKELGNVPHKLFPSLPAQPDIDWSKELGVENPDSVDKLIQFAGQYGPSLAIPAFGLGRAGQALSKVPGVGKFLTKAVSEAIPQAAYSAAQAPQDSLKAGAETGAFVAPFSVLSELIKSPSKKIRAAAKLAAGAGGAFLGREGAKGLGFSEPGADVIATILGGLGMRGFGTTKEMQQKMVEGVNPEVAAPRLKMAKELGLDYFTPAEAGISQWAAKRQGGLGRTAEGGKMLYDRAISRQESEKKAIQKTLDMIYTDKLDPAIDSAYKGLKEVNLPAEFPMQYQGNKVIEAAEKRIKSSPAYQESMKKYLPENVKLEDWQSNPQPTSLVYWDHVKRALYDLGEEAARKGNNEEAAIYKDTRRDLVNKMDEQYPEYADARAMYERKKVREGLESVFDKKDITGRNFYKALESSKKFDELMKKLRNAPEAAENLKKMRELFKNILGVPTIQTVKGAEERGMFQDRNTGSFLESLMEHVFTKGVNDKSAIEFITSPDWLENMKDLEKISNKQLKLAALAMMLTRAGGQAVGQQESKPLELELIGGHR